MLLGRWGGEERGREVQGRLGCSSLLGRLALLPPGPHPPPPSVCAAACWTMVTTRMTRCRCEVSSAHTAWKGAGRHLLLPPIHPPTHAHLSAPQQPSALPCRPASAPALPPWRSALGLQACRARGQGQAPRPASMPAAPSGGRAPAPGAPPRRQDTDAPPPPPATPLDHSLCPPTRPPPHHPFESLHPPRALHARPTPPCSLPSAAPAAAPLAPACHMLPPCDTHPPTLHPLLARDCASSSTPTPPPPRGVWTPSTPSHTCCCCCCSLLFGRALEPQFSPRLARLMPAGSEGARRASRPAAYSAALAGDRNSL